MSRLPLAAGLLVLLALAYLTASRPAFALAYALGLLLVLAWAWTRLAARGVTLERRLNPGRASVGERFQETFSLRRRGLWPAPWVEVSDCGAPAGYRPGRVISLGAEPVSWTAEGVHRARGWASFGPTQVVIREPFGLFSRRLLLGAPQRVLVYPRLRPLPALESPAAQHHGGSRRLGLWAEAPPETAGVRDHVPGDAFGRVHWPLSQRHQRLMSRTFEQPLATDLWLVLDLEAAVHGGQGEGSTLEQAVSVAASVVAQVRSRGRRVGLIANDARATLIDPGASAETERLILRYLALARADGAASLAASAAWDRLRRLPRRPVVVVTPRSDATWTQALRGLRGGPGGALGFWVAARPEQRWPAEAAEIDLYVVRPGGEIRLLEARDAAVAG